jgi:uncharacterized membrane protein
MCFTDVQARYGFPGVAAGKLPYLDAPNEYPVLTGFAIYLAGLPSGSTTSFFGWTALILGFCGVVAGLALARIAGPRALTFALAPTLLLVAFFNWDLLAVAPAALATLFFLRGRDGLSGAMLGLGAAAKLYPGLLVVPFLADRWREGRRAGARSLAGWAVRTWLLANLPVAIAAPGGWWDFYRISSERGVDLYSVWAFPERLLGFTWPVWLLNVLVSGTFVVLVAWLWRSASSRNPDLPLWTLGFPLIGAFLLTGKAYSPGYSLWLVPWFALALPDLRLFLAFELTDVAVFVTVFQWSSGAFGKGWPFWALEAAVIARAVVLASSLVAWTRRQPAGTLPRHRSGSGPTTTPWPPVWPSGWGRPGRRGRPRPPGGR